VSPPDVDLSVRMAAFSLPLPYRHRQGNGTLAAMHYGKKLEKSGHPL